MKRHTLVLLAVLVCRAAFADEADDARAVKTVLDAAVQHDRGASRPARSRLHTEVISGDRPLTGPPPATRHEVGANLPVGALVQVYLGEETMDLVHTLHTIAERARDRN